MNKEELINKLVDLQKKANNFRDYMNDQFDEIYRIIEENEECHHKKQ